MGELDTKDCLSESSIDDLLRRVLEILLRELDAITATKGEFTERTGVLLEVTNPRARLSRTELKGTIFSCLGELLWYLAGSNELDFIKYYISNYDEYSDDGKTLYGAYGPRLLYVLKNGTTQLQSIIQLLKRKPTSRRAVIQIYDKNDTAVKKTHDLPCTCTLQFLIRHDRLHMITNMRSNDAYKGLPHDVFTFTMLQELVARSVNKEVGTYKHVVGSLHLYNDDRDKAKDFINQGWSSNIFMPEMPTGSPWNAIKKVLRLEKKIRTGDGSNIVLGKEKLDDYWMDIVRMLLVYKMYKNGDASAITRISGQMASDTYRPYIERRYELINE